MATVCRLACLLARSFNTLSPPEKRGGSSSGSNKNSSNNYNYIHIRQLPQWTKMRSSPSSKKFLMHNGEDLSVDGMEGISKLCDKLDLDPLKDIRILVLLWKLGSKEKPAQISREEWISGCQTLQADSINKFKALLPSLDTGFRFREASPVSHLGMAFLFGNREGRFVSSDGW